MQPVELSFYIFFLFVVFAGLLLFSPFTFEMVVLPGQRVFSVAWVFLKYDYDSLQKTGTARIGFLKVPFKGKKVIPVKRKKPKARRKKKVPAAVLFTHRETLPKLLQESLLALVRILGSLNLKQANVEIVYGNEDPAATGMLYGLYSTLPRSFLPANLRFELSPDFEEETFRSSMNLEIQCRLYRLIWIMLLFLWAIPRIQTIKLLRDLKKR